jgi:5'-nucleotidase
MSRLRYVFGLFLALCLSLAHAGTPVSVKILSFNDFHGNLQSPGAFSGNPSGGVDYLAAYIAKMKSQNPNTFVVTAGDLFGASPLISAFFYDEGTIETMNRLGLDFDAVGNHEFDAGKVELLRKQQGGCHPSEVNTCNGAAVGTPVPFEGAKFKFLSANVIDNATGKPLFPAYGIKTVNGLRIAFIGMTLVGTPGIVTPAGVAGLTFKDEADTVNALVPRLKAMGVNAIVVLVHQGGFQASTAPNFINDCSGALQTPIISPIKGIVSRLDNAVDLVISGHTHTGYICQLPNKVGRNIPVTQASAFGRVLTDVNMTLDSTTGKVTAVTAQNIIVNRNDVTVVPFINPQIQSIVSGYNALVSPLANQVVGTITAATTNSANTAGEMKAGDLIADAQLAATAPAGLGGAQFAFMNAGGVRNPGFVAPVGGTYPYNVTYGNSFTVQPFGNSLVTMTLTAQQVKDVLEQQFVGCNGQIAQRIMQVSGGFNYSWSLAAAPCSKIVNVTFTLSGGATDTLVSGGVVIDPTKTYRVTVNNFMATGGDGFSVLVGGASQLGGAQDIDALVAYFANFKSPNPPFDPAAVAPRIIQLP